jgi:hypothetical protein
MVDNLQASQRELLQHSTNQRIHHSLIGQKLQERCNLECQQLKMLDVLNACTQASYQERILIM